MTTGYFWQTLGMFLVMGFISSAAVYALGGMLVLGGLDSAATVIVAAPIMCLVLAFLIHVRALVCTGPQACCRAPVRLKSFPSLRTSKMEMSNRRLAARGVGYRLGCIAGT